MSTEPPKLNDCGIICYHDNKNVTYITLYAEYVPLTLKPTLYPRSYLRCLSSHLAAERPWHRLAMRHHEGFGTIGGDAAQMFLHYLAGEMIWNWFPSVLWSKRDNKLIILTHSLILCLTGLALTFFEGISQLMNNAQEWSRTYSTACFIKTWLLYSLKLIYVISYCEVMHCYITV